MRSLALAGVLGALALTGCGAERGDPAPSDVSAAVDGSPEAFVRSLYAGDEAAKERRTDPRSVYSARTAALFEENGRLYEGYVGHPDADPICDCQDDEGVAVTRATTRIVDADHARVEVALTNGQSHTFVLVREAGNWRIDDVEGLSGGPLVAGLEASNAEAAANPPR